MKNPSEVIPFMDIAKRYGIFAALFVGLLIFVLRGYEIREERLMDYLSKQIEINSSIATTLEKIDIRIQKLEGRHD